MKKSTDGTQTAMGFIPHYPFNGIACPVLVKTEVAKDRKGNQYRKIITDNKGYPFPEMSNGSFVYAMPGGGILMAPQV